MSTTATDLYSLYWSNHTRNLKHCFDIFRCDNELVDVTLSCEGRKLKAHKIVLSACSVYFLDLFRDNPCQHPIIILRDIKYNILVDILNFMYQGEVNVDIEQLDTFLKTAEVLQVKGLTEDKTYSPESESSTITTKQKNSMEIDPLLGNNEFSLPVKRFKETDLNTEETINPTPTKDDLMQETMDIGRTDSEFSASTTPEPPDYLDLNLISNRSHENDLIPAHSHEIKNEKAMSSKYSFPCRFCDKVFSHPNSLKLHLPSHSGSTSCGLCQAVLSRKYELKVHMRKKHNIDLN